MAYKFQLGSAILSGTMKVEETLNAASGFQLAGAAVTATAAELNVLDGLADGAILLGDGAGAANALDVKGDGKILIGDGSTANSVVVSGDAVIANDGALTIENDAVTNAKLANITRGSIKVGGASNAPTDLDAKTNGYILVGDGTDVNSVAVSGDVTLANDGAVTIANNAVDENMLSSSVAGLGLSGGGGSALALDFSELTDEAIASGDRFAFRDAGDDGMHAETVDDLATLFAGDGLTATSAVIALDLNELTAASVNVGADSIAIIDADDSNGSRKESIADLVSAMAGSGLSASNGVLSTDGAAVHILTDTNMNLSGGVNVYNGAAPAASRAYTLPSGSNLSNGDVIRVKAGDLATNSVSASIQCQGTDKIEGTLTQIDLESPGAAVTIIYAGSGGFVVF